MMIIIQHKCDYAASRKGDLRRRIKGKHDNVSYHALNTIILQRTSP